MLDTLSTISVDSNFYDLFWKGLFPLITLVIGAIIAIGSQKFLERLERKKTKKYLIYSLSHLSESIDGQIKNIDTFIKKLEQKPSEIPQLEFNAGFHMKNIDIISRNDLYNIFVIKKSGKEKENSASLNNFLDYLEILRENINFIETDIILLRKKNNDYKESYNEIYGELINKINSKFEIYLNQEMPGDLKNADLQKWKIQKKLALEIYDLNQLFFKKNAQYINIFETHDKYLKPLFKLTNQYNDIELSRIMPKIMLICEEFIFFRDNYIETFKSINMDLMLVSKNLKNTFA